jgi:3-polyprenyl-4-hydroxybenzoate decarboxylase
MSVFDLRQWLADADHAGELEHVRGADAVLEIGAASQLNYRRQRPRALLFDEIAGYRPGQRVLTSSLCNPALMGMTLGLGAGLDDGGLVDALRGRSVMKSAMATDALISSGLPGVAGVWCHEAGGGRSLVVVAVEQRYAGHSRQAGYLAAQHPVTAYMNRLVITVDQDVNPRDLDEVMWAVSTRCDPQRDIDIMRYGWGSRADPLGPPGQPAYNSRALIDACRPHERLADFPAVAQAGDDLLRRAAQRWPELAR